MFRTIVQQTVQNKNNLKYVEANGPFPVEDIASSFLGAGYYFWDNHIELAHWWGKQHCKRRYYICECGLEIDEDLFLDLVGNRQDQINIKDLIDKLQIGDLTLGEIIEVLKDIQLEDSSSGVFPYKAIRALDYSNKPSFYQYKYMFKQGNSSFSILSPMYIICLIEKNEVLLPPYKVTYSQ